MMKMSSPMPRQPEPELMDHPAEAEVYALADFSEVNSAFVDRLLDLTGLRDRAKVVDLGTGPADIPIRAVKARPTWQVTAIDASPIMLDLAQRAVDQAGLADSIELVPADAKATGLPEDTFDIVISNSILHHLSNTDQFWIELRRIGKPGAIVLLRDLARPETPEMAERIVEQHAGGESKLLREEFYRSLLSAYTTEEVLSQLKHVGLTCLNVDMVSDRHLDVYGHLPPR